MNSQNTNVVFKENIQFDINWKEKDKNKTSLFNSLSLSYIFKKNENAEQKQVINPHSFMFKQTSKIQKDSLITLQISQSSQPFYLLNIQQKLQNFDLFASLKQDLIDHHKNFLELSLSKNITKQFLFRIFYKKMTHFTKHDIFGTQFNMNKTFQENQQKIGLNAKILNNIDQNQLSINLSFLYFLKYNKNLDIKLQTHHNFNKKWIHQFCTQVNFKHQLYGIWNVQCQLYNNDKPQYFLQNFYKINDNLNIRLKLNQKLQLFLNFQQKLNENIKILNMVQILTKNIGKYNFVKYSLAISLNVQLQFFKD